jgi:hypothetical protein
MGNRSMRDERQRAGAPGRGSLFGKKPTPDTPEAPPPSDSPTKDLSVVGAARKLRGRKARIDEASDY